jgi:hypothetical protein
MLLAFFFWLSAPVVRYGLTDEDDGLFALAATNVATGQGYGTPASSERFVPFHPYITTGPAVILPVATVIRIFGALDWLPGAATLAIFLAQLTVAALVLARRFGWRQVTGFVFTTMLLVAAYLELAQRLELPLASLDQELRKAATAIGVPLVDLAT